MGNLAERVLLHIGSGKTGTTSVQQTLSANRKMLADAGYTYPLLGKDHQHDFASSYISDVHRLPRGIRSQYPSENTLVHDKLMATRNRWLKSFSGAERLLLSSEYFSQLTRSEITELRDDLLSVGFGEFKIIYYVRDPVGYYLSVAQQYLKAGHGFAHYKGFECRFMDQIERWSETFPGQVVVRKFAPEALVKGDVFQDVAAEAKVFFGVAIPIEQIRAIRSNESLSAEGMALLQEYRKALFPSEENRFNRSSNFLVQFLQDNRDRFGQTRPLLKPAIANHIRQRHLAQMSRLCDSFGICFQMKIAEDASQELLDPEVGPLRVADILADWDEERFGQFRMHVLNQLLISATSA